MCAGGTNFPNFVFSRCAPRDTRNFEVWNFFKFRNFGISKCKFEISDFTFEFANSKIRDYISKFRKFLVCKARISCSAFLRKARTDPRPHKFLYNFVQGKTKILPGQHFDFEFAKIYPNWTSNDQNLPPANFGRIPPPSTAKSKFQSPDSEAEFRRNFVNCEISLRCSSCWREFLRFERIRRDRDGAGRPGPYRAKIFNQNFSRHEKSGYMHDLAQNFNCLKSEENPENLIQNCLRLILFSRAQFLLNL